MMLQAGISRTGVAWRCQVKQDLLMSPTATPLTQIGRYPGSWLTLNFAFPCFAQWLLKLKNHLPLRGQRGLLTHFPFNHTIVRHLFAGAQSTGGPFFDQEISGKKKAASLVAAFESQLRITYLGFRFAL